MINIFKKLSITNGFQIFQMLRFAALLVSGILLSKSDISISAIGTYEGLIFLSGALSFFWVNGILNTLLSHYKVNENNNKSFLFNTVFLLIAMSAFLILILMIFRNAASNFLPDCTPELFTLLLTYIFLNNPTFLLEHIFLLKNKVNHLISYGVFHFLGYIAAVTLPVWMGFEITYSLYGLILLSTIKFILLGFIVHKEDPCNFDKNTILKLISFASPLILSFAIAGCAEYIDGFLVSTHFGSDQFAIFRYGARELPLAVLLSSSLSTSFIPRLQPLNNTFELGNLRKEAGKLMHVLFPISILLLFFSDEFYPIIFRAEFVASAPIFNTYILLLVSRVLFPQTLILASGKTKVILGIALVELAIKFSCSYFLMLNFGLIGIAAGTVIAFYAEKIILIIYVKRKLGIAISNYLPINRWIFYSSLLLLIYFFN
ncbi:MAG: hypothetical protein IPK10_03745 [Bacteroidetes bacterium]|nr:hypothetical protein [Bacteroidota bacterium]